MDMDCKGQMNFPQVCYISVQFMFLNAFTLTKGLEIFTGAFICFGALQCCSGTVQNWHWCVLFFMHFSVGSYWILLTLFQKKPSYMLSWFMLMDRIFFLTSVFYLFYALQCYNEFIFRYC